MNVWQYSRWTYLIGRSIKNKSLESSEREAFTTFINEILKTRPMLSSQLNIKKGSNALGLYEQNDYSLGKMLQIVGRNLKVLAMTEEEKKLCDRLFFSTDERRYMTYNEYQALDGKNVFVTEDENLSDVINNCDPYSVIILSQGTYNVDLNISTNGIKIKSDEKAIINGQIIISTNDIFIENITIQSEIPILIISNNISNNISFEKTNIETCIEINNPINQFKLKESTVYSEGSAILLKSIGENVVIEDCKINGSIEFNQTLINASISNNTIFAETGIIFNGENDENIIIEGNKFNVEQ